MECKKQSQQHKKYYGKTKNLKTQEKQRKKNKSVVVYSLGTPWIIGIGLQNSFYTHIHIFLLEFIGSPLAEYFVREILI